MALRNQNCQHCCNIYCSGANEEEVDRETDPETSQEDEDDEERFYRHQVSIVGEDSDSEESSAYA